MDNSPIENTPKPTIESLSDQVGQLILDYGLLEIYDRLHAQLRHQYYSETNPDLNPLWQDLMEHTERCMNAAAKMPDRFHWWGSEF
ncbi:MAG: hypothetical protein SFT94_05865 [Pseudanabaenaceae cyanobacterium bins.68]|nr:hypothetical protein [Pseudanabaenaceae cyanobacterium bins.68]